MALQSGAERQEKIETLELVAFMQLRRKYACNPKGHRQTVADQAGEKSKHDDNA